MIRRFGGWLRGIQFESLTRMKWAFLLMVGLSVYSTVGASPDTGTAPLAGLAWMVGIVLFLTATVMAFREMGARYVGQYVSGTHGVRRVLLFAVMLWTVVIVSATIAWFFINIFHDGGYDEGFEWMSNAPTVAFVLATLVLGFVFYTLGPSALTTPEGVTRAHARGRFLYQGKLPDRAQKALP